MTQILDARVTSPSLTLFVNHSLHIKLFLLSLIQLSLIQG